MCHRDGGGQLGTGSHGRTAATGAYLARLRIGAEVQKRKITLLK